MSSFCTRCGAAAGERQLFCTECGQPLRTGRPADADIVEPPPAATAWRPPSVTPPLTVTPPPPTSAAAPPPASSHRRALVVVIALILLAGVGTGVALAVGGSDQARPGPVGTTTVVPSTGSAPVTSSSPPSSSSSAASPSPTPSATTSAAAQASAVDALLASSAAARADVSSAIADITACRNDPASVTSEVDRLQSAIASRRRLLDTLASTEFGLLPAADVLRADLVAAWTASIDADGYYAAWAQTHAHCSGGVDANEQAGDDVSTTRSRVAKADFVTRWNPIAVTYGLAQRTPTEF